MSKELTKTFEWRERGGNMIPVTRMDTHHLFYTLRMIWNHSAPEEHRLEPYHRYSFPAFYTVEYVAEAVRAMLKEIQTRGDMQYPWKLELNYMKGVILRNETDGDNPGETKRVCS